MTALTADRHMHTGICLMVTFDVFWVHQPDDSAAALTEQSVCSANLILDCMHVHDMFSSCALDTSHSDGSSLAVMWDAVASKLYLENSTVILTY